MKPDDTLIERSVVGLDLGRLSDEAGTTRGRWLNRTSTPHPISTAANGVEHHGSCVCLRLGTPQDRDGIFELRHEVYASELGQHMTNADGRISDRLDNFNIYLVAEIAGRLAGFISITPPGGEGYSIDKYVARESLGFPIDDRLFEVRLLTVERSRRRQRLAVLLMYAAFRWVESRGGSRIVAMGRREILDFYLKAGLAKIGVSVQSGAVTYELLEAPVFRLRARWNGASDLAAKLATDLEWRLPMPFTKPAACFHGGAFFDAIGDGFEHLERRKAIVNADVLDAWFPASPKAEMALAHELGWLLRTSPPTDCAGLVRAIAAARGVRPDNILPGAGSSDLIFRAFREWLTPASKVVIVDPTYGEYAHVLEQVIRSDVRRISLARAHGFRLNLGELEAAVSRGCDLLVLVNPNSPTGQFVSRSLLEDFLRRMPVSTRVWVDETYIDYLTPSQSVESFAAHSENVIVCKSMSKVYGLSGARVAYLCAGAHQLESLRSVTPPWVVSLPAQLAAVRALEDLEYYQMRYVETHQLRQELHDALVALSLDVLPGCANFLLCNLPAHGPAAVEIVARCRSEGVFLRDAGATSKVLGAHALRIAVKDRSDNAKIIETLRRALG